MQINHPTALTLDDHAVLERLMCTLSGSPKPIASLVRRKLETAVILHPGADTDDLVTSGRRVRYWVNGELEADHYLTWEHPNAGDTSAISLQSPLGLALLGLSTGQSISFTSEAGIETAEVTGVTAVPSRLSRPAPQLSTIASKLQEAASIIKRRARLSLAHLQKGRTEATLMRLSDATLKDIGITRGEIPYVASIVAGLAPAPATLPTRFKEYGGKVRHLDSSEGSRRSTGRSITDVRNENTPARLFA